MPKRPGAGTRGRRIQLVTNFFEIPVVPSADLHMYNVQITPNVPKPINRMIIVHLRSSSHDLFEGNLTPAYDGEASLYYPKRMSWSSRVEIVELPDRRDKFTVKIEHVAVVSMSTLLAFLDGQDIDIPQDAIQALDVVLRTTPIATCTTIGSSFFSGKNTVPLDAGAEIWFGYHQSLRPAHGRLLVNLDIAASCFRKPQPVMELVASVTKNPLGQILDVNRGALRAELVGVKVFVTHRNEFKRRYIIRDIAKENALQAHFDVDDGARRTNVAEYFLERYQVRLRYPNLPLLVVGSKQKPTYLPIEVCNVLGGERINKLAPAQTASMIKKTATNLTVRLQHVQNAINERFYDRDPALKDFGIRVNQQLLHIDGRVLEPPTITYKPTSRNKAVKPNVGVLQPRDAQMYVSNPINHWGCLVIETRAREQEVMNFLKVLNGAGKEHGVAFQRPVLIPHRPQRRSAPDYREIIMRAIQQVQQTTKGQPQLLLIILPFGDPSAYGEIKRVCDTVLDVPSQCMQSKNMQRANPMYARNLLLKINARTGGVNNILSPSPSSDFLFSKPAIVFGADVSHAAPFSKLPSLAAVVASMDAFPFRYEVETRVQRSRQEIIEDLKSMAMNLLKRFHISTKGKKPERILFYRDGVSEGQFEYVLKHELNALRTACSELEANYSPKITFVIVQKRHHARFFVNGASSREADRSGNVPAGTVVDTNVVHPRQFDFYLVAHGGIQGTSRPTHYHCIFDENNFTADFLQDLTNRMCYLYARCTRSVSLVPAAYYAHLAAFRARYHSKADELEAMSGSISEASPTFGAIPTVRARTASQMYFI